MFKGGMFWRVCVGPQHPLAYNLYNEELPLSSRASIPYADLYAMKELEDNCWRIEDSEFGGIVGLKDFKPYVKVTLNDVQLNTLANPIKFLERSYGKDWRTEHSRKRQIS